MTFKNFTEILDFVSEKSGYPRDKMPHTTTIKTPKEKAKPKRRSKIKYSGKPERLINRALRKVSQVALKKPKFRIQKLDPVKAVMKNRENTKFATKGETGYIKQEFKGEYDKAKMWLKGGVLEW